MSKLNLENFQKEVLKQYYTLKRVREKEAEFSNVSEIPFPDRGRTGNFFYSRTVRLFKKCLGLANKRRIDVKVLLSDSKVRAVICPQLSDLSDADEETFIRTIVKILASEPDLDIPLDPELFGFICDEILHRGINDYCRDF
jgi:hypothetical protein